MTYLNIDKINSSVDSCVTGTHAYLIKYMLGIKEMLSVYA